MDIRDDFLAKFPEFTGEQLDRLDDTIANYKYYYNYKYDIKNKEAILYAIAHLLYLSNTTGEGTSGVMTSGSVDGVAVSFPVSEMTNLSLIWNSSDYGRRFNLIRNRSGRLKLA